MMGNIINAISNYLFRLSFNFMFYLAFFSGSGPLNQDKNV